MPLRLTAVLHIVPAMMAFAVTAIFLAGCEAGIDDGFANPVTGACASRPSGLVASDLAGTYHNDGTTITLRANGTFRWSTTPPPASPAPARSATPASSASTASASTAPSSPPADPHAQPALVSGRWSLAPATTDDGDINFTVTSPSHQQDLPSVYVSGTRAQPSLYSFDYSDPDALDDCSLIHYQRAA